MTSISIDEIIDRIMSGRIMPKTRVKYPCSICCKAVRNNQGAVQCDLCDLWVHNKCNGTTDKEYELLKLSDETQSVLIRFHTPTTYSHRLLLKLRILDI